LENIGSLDTNFSLVCYCEIFHLRYVHQLDATASYRGTHVFRGIVSLYGESDGGDTFSLTITFHNL
jgi:hypothetical protein